MICAVVGAVPWAPSFEAPRSTAICSLTATNTEKPQHARSARLPVSGGPIERPTPPIDFQDAIAGNNSHVAELSR